MISGSLNITLRPLRLAFIVSPGDKAAIFDAIRINSYLWGGQYNPIIPLFRKLPRWVRSSRPATAAHLFAAYLDLYDPDFVIRLGSTKNEVVEFGNLKEVSADELLESVGKYETPNYGIGIFEILEHLLREEFRFVRHDSLEIRIPDAGDDLFLASVFGTFPDKFPDEVASRLKSSLSYREEPCNRELHVVLCGVEFIPTSNFSPQPEEQKKLMVVGGVCILIRCRRR